MVYKTLPKKVEKELLEALLSFTLVYEGQLLEHNPQKPQFSHTHEIRKVFHRQLKRLREEHFFLRDIKPEELAAQHEVGGYKYVPLVTKETKKSKLHCSLKILFLYQNLLQNIDNQLKTIFDSLSLPVSKDDLDGHEAGSSKENPFFCLLEDESLIMNTQLETDLLLKPKKEESNGNDVLLIIGVRIQPIIFFYPAGIDSYLS